MNNNEARRLLELANARLQRGKIGVSLEMRGKEDWLYLRGTFPPKPGSDPCGNGKAARTRPYQQRIALKMRGTPSAIKQAEAVAKVVGGELNLGTFDWMKWSDAEDPAAPKTVAQWVKEFEEHFWRGRDRNNSSQMNTWLKAYKGPLKKLPKVDRLTLDLMIDWVTENSESNSRRRGQYCTCARELGRLAGIVNLDVFRELAGNYSTKPINPRDLPTDEEIVGAIDSITDPGWRFLAALQATYGLRNHECFGVDYSEFPIIRVRGGTKTGTRPVGAVPPQWAERWDLSKPIYPAAITLGEGLSNEQLGMKITGFYGRAMPWSAYNLRHCYARRCAEVGLAPDVAAQLMGHSLLVHLQIYRAWIGEKVYLDRYRQAMSAAQLPLLNGD
jgi:integrase